MPIELLMPVCLSALAVFVFLVVHSLTESAYDGPGVVVGMMFMAISATGFVAAMITFAIKYYFYISTTGLDLFLKSLGGG